MVARRATEEGPVEWLNYNQFYYFWIIAQEQSVTRAASRLRLSQSNLSAQLRLFEDRIGQPLFDRVGRSLQLTEAGKLALDYARGIFQTGQEFLDVLGHRPVAQKRTLVRVGAISSLSKNLQHEFIRPLLTRHDVKIIVVEGSLHELIRQLQDHLLDVVISNVSARSDSTPEVYNHRLGAIPVFAVGVPKYRTFRRSFPRCLETVPVFLPGRSARYRTDLDAWLDRQKVVPLVRAEIEDMALLRILAMTGDGLALVPEIVVRDELKDGTLIRLQRVPQIAEVFYAVTATRRFPNVHVERIVREFAEARNKPWSRRQGD
ncbi:MAG: LysR family transcriptional regulator [Acidobacteriota bacterium]|nr:LysR family transcriptional regulator [Acidobacteriota bacterium]